MAAASMLSRDFIAERLERALLNPIRAFRPRYLPQGYEPAQDWPKGARQLEAIPAPTVHYDTYQDDGPSPEASAISKTTYRTLLALIDRLPERCGTIVRLRKVEGWSQREIAAHLGTTEKAVEKQVWLGVGLLRDAWRRAENDAEERLSSSSQAKIQRWW